MIFLSQSGAIIHLVFLYFSDWTTGQNIAQMNKKGFPHADRLLKVFATTKDPSAILNRTITTTEEDGRPFVGTYSYPGRGPWVEEDLEFYIKHCKLTENAAQEARALFRFANRPNLEIAQLAMSIKNALTGEWHYRHPLRIVDGLDKALERGIQTSLHLDIFTTRSVERLTYAFNLENPQNLASKREVLLISKEKELPVVSKERA